MSEAPRDQNHVPSALFESSSTPGLTIPGQINQSTGRVLVDAAGGGTVETVSIATANGFAGTSDGDPADPTITLSTTVTGIVKGNGTALSAATAGTDYTALAFKTIAVSGQSDIVADGPADTLTVAAGSNITITTNATTDTLTIAATVPAAGITVGTTTITSGTDTRILYDNAGVVGEYTLTGTGTVVVMQTAPTFVTSITAPLLIGGSGTTGTQLTLKTTTGNGTTDQMVFVGGNNGATTFATLKANSLDLGTSAVFTTGTIELGHASANTLSASSGVLSIEGVVIPTVSSTNTLTNKRVTRRLTTTNAPGATPTTNTDNVDIQVFTGLNTAITSMTTNLSGTPVDGDFLEFMFLDDGTARAITWGSSFANGGVQALPTTTVISVVLRVLLQYQTAASLNKWVCVAVA